MPTPRPILLGLMCGVAGRIPRDDSAAHFVFARLGIRQKSATHGNARKKSAKNPRKSGMSAMLKNGKKIGKQGVLVTEHLRLLQMTQDS